MYQNVQGTNRNFVLHTKLFNTRKNVALLILSKYFNVHAKLFC